MDLKLDCRSYSSTGVQVTLILVDNGPTVQSGEVGNLDIPKGRIKCLLSVRG